MHRNRYLFGCFALSIVVLGCSSLQGRKISSISSDDNTAFDRVLSDFGIHAYRANLHSHHFMKYVPPKKDRPKGEILVDGPCAVKGNFPEDDGRPCHENDDGENWFYGTGSDDRIDYFKMACSYAKEQGELDILFVTPHTKDGTVQADTSTTFETISARQKLLKKINDDNQGQFYCGLGQEASSISSGNHMGILGHFGQDRDSVAPFFFKTGAFDQLYPQVKARVDAGEPVILTLNHPNVTDDLWWKDLGQDPAPKDSLNDYGIDDYAPLGCIVKPRGVAGCAASTEERRISYEMLKATFANIRNASGDAIRLVETVSPGDAAENSTVKFKPVHHRLDDHGQPTDEMNELNEGLYDYVFYLAMGLHVSPVADQDNHHSNWGTATASRTGVLAPSLNESAVVSALQNRRTFASEDKNAKLIFFSDKTLMGDEMSTSASEVTLSVGYQDPDNADKSARLRLYYYRENDALDFSHDAQATDVFRLIAFNHDSSTLPQGPSANYSQIPTDEDSVAIESGQVIPIRIPVVKGLQYVFAEITQTQDNDKIYSAPIWIRKEL